MKNKIGICWSFSVGKSTLTSELCKILDTKQNNEVARDLLENWFSLPKKDYELFEFQKHIIYNQQQIEKQDNFITDATLIEALAYSKDINNINYYNIIEREIKEYYNKKVYDIIFYIPIEFEIEDDWIRHTDKDFQKTIDNRIKENLKKYNPAKQIIELKWTVEERIKKALRYIS